MAADQREHPSDVEMRRPGGEGDGAAGLQHAQHLADGDRGTRREHVAELAEHHVELVVAIGQAFGVAFGEVDIEVRQLRVLAGAFDQDWRQVEAPDLRTAARCRDRGNAGAAADVEQPLAGGDPGEAHELGGRGRREHLHRREQRPGLLLDCLETSKRVLVGHGTLPCSMPVFMRLTTDAKGSTRAHDATASPPWRSYCTRSATMVAALRPVPVRTATVVSFALMAPVADSLSSAAAALALVGSANRPCRARRRSAAAISSSVSATVPPPLSRNAPMISRRRSGCLIAVPSAMVLFTSRATGVSTPALKLASIGEQLSGCAVNRRGSLVIWPAFNSSRKPKAQPSRELPAPTGTMTLSGARKPRSSQIS